MTINFLQIKGISRYRLRRIMYIAIFWTVIDIIIKVLDVYDFNREIMHSIIVRECLVFVMSFIMGYLFVYTLKQVFKFSTPIVNFFAKSIILLICALLMNFLVHFAEDIMLVGATVSTAVQDFLRDIIDTNWLISKTLYWKVLFIITQLFLEINDKYSPGVFLDILRGKYRIPKVEDKIVMFMDLKDSTPIAERLGHEQYFLFIKSFIHYVSLAIIENEGVIYQYVGDEIVVSWDAKGSNFKRSLKSIIAARKNLQKRAARFKQQFGCVPEFRVGLHVGSVTIGEIGIIKKDLAMSGDTMNTTARIRSACNELGEKHLISKDFYDRSSLKPYQVKELGVIDLKGKSYGVDLLALQV